MFVRDLEGGHQRQRIHDGCGCPYVCRRAGKGVGGRPPSSSSSSGQEGRPPAPPPTHPPTDTHPSTRPPPFLQPPLPFLQLFSRCVSAQQRTRRAATWPSASQTASSCCERVQCAPTLTRRLLRTSPSTSGWQLCFLLFFIFCALCGCVLVVSLGVV